MSWKDTIQEEKKSWRDTISSETELPSPSAVDTPEESIVDKYVLPALAGFSQGATLGLGDEIYGAQGAVTGAIQSIGTDKPMLQSAKDKYSEFKDYSRGLNKQMAEKSPVPYYAGDIGGGVALTAGIPLSGAKGASVLSKIGTPIVSGAGLGAAQAGGYSDSDDLTGDIIKGGAAGAVIGGGGALLSGGVKKIADSGALKQLGITKRDISKIINEKGPEEGYNFLDKVAKYAQNNFKANSAGEIRVLTDLDNPLKATNTANLVRDTVKRLGFEKKTTSYLDENLLKGSNRDILNKIDDISIKAKDVAVNAPDIETLQNASEKLKIADFIKEKIMRKGVRSSSDFDWLTGTFGRGAAGAVLGASLSDDKLKGGLLGGTVSAAFKKSPLVANKMIQQVGQPVTKQLIKGAALGSTSKFEDKVTPTIERMKADPQYSGLFKDLENAQAAVKHNILIKNDIEYRKKAMERDEDI